MTPLPLISRDLERNDSPLLLHLNGEENTDLRL